MAPVRRLLALLAVAALVAPMLAILDASPAVACSCVSGDPVDSAAGGEVVFTGRAVENEGSEYEPVWRFEVDGVIKGAVDPVQIVIGEDWGGGCGNDYGRFGEAVVVYAHRDGGDLRAVSCAPTPTAESFAAMLTQRTDPTGTGPPRAVMVGRYRASDLAVLDAQGRTIARADVGLGGSAVAHCAGTTLAAIVSGERPSMVSIVDLATLAVVDERPLDIEWLSPTGDRLVCLDAGARVVAARGYGPNEDGVAVATSVSAATGGADARRTFEGVSRVVIHRAGTVIALPTTVGDPLRTYSAMDLEPIGTDAALPDGASTLDADVSPDGSRLAILATLSGQPVEYDSGASHVITVDLVDGTPVAGSASVVALGSSGSIESSRLGAAKWIRWVDASTWVIEHETVSTKRATFVATDGTEILRPVDIGWGWGLVALDAGVLRVRNGGVEIITRDGESIVGDPAPSSQDFARMLAIDRIIDAPAFEMPNTATEPLTITPIADVVAAATTPAPAPGEDATAEPGRPGSDDAPLVDETDETEPAAEAEPAPRDDESSSAGVSPPGSGSDGRGWLPWAGAGAVVAAIALGLAARQRSRTALEDPVVRDVPVSESLEG